MDRIVKKKIQLPAIANLVLHVFSCIPRETWRWRFRTLVMPLVKRVTSKERPYLLLFVGCLGPRLGNVPFGRCLFHFVA